MKLLTKYYDTFGGRVLPYDEFRLFSDIPAAANPKDGINTGLISPHDRESIIKRAESYLSEPYPQLLASDFIRFERIGDHAKFESLYFLRRGMALIFALAEAIERKGRFTDRIMDGVTLILDEQDWVIPAHIDHRYPLNPWYKDHPYIDLFAAETGSTLAYIWLFAHDALDKITPLICERLKFEVHERITKAFLEHDMYWMGLNGNSVNNWNPWILSNVLGVCAILEEDTGIRERVADRVARCADSFINVYHTDGGCDEGPSYWTAAGASLYSLLEQLYDMTGGYVDIFSEPLIRRMAEYEADFHICGSYFINFADCPARVGPNYRMIARCGRRAHSETLRDFGDFYAKKFPQDVSGWRWHLYYSVKSMLEPIRDGVDYKPSTEVWYDGIQVMAEREFPADDKGFFLAAKGGHNNESHNHNDVGNFVVYNNGEPLLLDSGCGKYTKKTFSAHRYDIWTMCSDYHNLPTVNGVTQSPGGQFKATDVSFENHTLTLDISKAYPESAGLDSLVREVSMKDGVIVVSDHVKLKAPGKVVFSLLCGKKCDFSEKGVIRFGDGSKLFYSDNLTAEPDTDFDVCMEDDSVKRNWNGVEISRVFLKTSEFTEDEFSIKITH